MDPHLILLEHVTCPISFQPLWDPVVANDGKTYNKAFIEAHLNRDRNPKSPITGEFIDAKIIQNDKVKDLLIYCLEHTNLLDEHLKELDIDDIILYDLLAMINARPRIKEKLDPGILSNFDQKYKEHKIAINTNRFIGALNNRKEKVALAIFDNKSEINMKYIDNKGNTFLQLAIKKKMSNVALKLLEVADIDICHVNTSGKTALALALTLAFDGILSDVILKIFEKGIGHDYVDVNGNNILQLAIKKKMDKVALCIISNKNINIDINHANKKGNTALIAVISKYLSHIALKILENKNVDINHTNKIGNSSLIVACKKNMSDVALKLLEVDNIDIEKVNKYGNNAIYHAKKNKMTKVINRIAELCELKILKC